MLRKILILIAIFISIIQISNAQYGFIKGTVKDSAGKTIYGASIMVVGTLKEAIVKDKNGHFSIMKVPPGRREIVIKASGFESQNIRCLIMKDSIVHIDIVLKKNKNEPLNEMNMNDPKMMINNYNIGTIWIWDSNYYFK
jgi:hypothetical protein